jgi:tetratricopeptide (TPR) repeat protein
MQGRPEEAEALFQQSIEVKPTAEGYTFHGWAISYLGRLDEAIEDCKKAIALDPDFGNPYNDIGVYLMQKGQLDEAVGWLEQAKQARRYEPRHFPYFNLGRIYEQKGLWREAIKEYQASLREKPEFASARDGIARLRARMN